MPEDLIPAQLTSQKMTVYPVSFIMNYLAHAYLSFQQPGILTGNLISDFIKGKKQFGYPDAIRKGIRLHRAIDSFTDRHPVTREAKKIFTASVGAYAGAFMDVVYDHFLALDENELTASGWKIFSATVYRELLSQKDLLPEDFARILPFMESQDWLYNYRFDHGIENSFSGLSRRAKYLTGKEAVFPVFKSHYADLDRYYKIFFPDVKNFARRELDGLLME